MAGAVWVLQETAAVSKARVEVTQHEMGDQAEVLECKERELKDLKLNQAALLKVRISFSRSLGHADVWADWVGELDRVLGG